MSDFSQRGLISTLQKLEAGPDAHLLPALTEFNRQRPIVAVVPCHGTDLQQPAATRILTGILEAPFVRRLVLSVNEASPEELQSARASLPGPPEKLLILCSDSAAASQFIPFRDATAVHGKGANVWAATGWLSINEPNAIVAFQDCDVRTFEITQLARLLFAVAQPEMGYGFAKLYYSRLAGQMFGRVSRLFFIPLLQALTRTLGHHPLLDFLGGFRYPLAGEFALPVSLARSLPLQPAWGLETGMLCEIFRRMEPRDVCQVDAGAHYDHKHQPLGDAAHGLGRMALEIARTLFGELETEGIQFTPGLRQSIVQSYRREAVDSVRRYRTLALINAINYDVESETGTVAHFAALLADLTSAPAPILPSWDSWMNTSPDLAHDFLAAMVFQR